MRILVLLTTILAVTLGLPLEPEDKLVPVNEADQRPLVVGDLLPVQGHVVVENPAPQPRLDSNQEHKKSAPFPEEKISNVQDQKSQVNAVFEEAPIVVDLKVDNNEKEENSVAGAEQNPNPGDKVSFGLNGEEMELVEAYLESNDEMVHNAELDHMEEGEAIQDLESKYEMFEQPIMKLEPLASEEMQTDELLHINDGVYEEPIMFLEPEMVSNEEISPNAVDMENEGPMFDPLGPLMSGEEINKIRGRHSCPGKMLDGKCFQFFQSPKKAADAEFYCQENFPGGHLASITSAVIHNEMMNLMRQNGGTRRTWVGGLRFLDTGRFIWLDGSSWNYADWQWGEPNNTVNVENCLEVLASGKFNDFTCWEPQAFICSYPYQ